jgi:hypothetical protein
LRGPGESDHAHRPLKTVYCYSQRLTWPGWCDEEHLWGSVLLGGFLAELAMFVVVIPLSLLVRPQNLLYSAPPASFTALLEFGL